MPVVESYRAGTPCWVDLASTNAESAKEFYGALFGWNFSGNPIDPDGVYYMATINGKNVAGLVQQPEEAGAQSEWTTYLAVDDVDAAAEKAVAAGGTQLCPVGTVLETAGRMTMVRDPGGAQLGLWQAQAHIGASLVNEPGTVIWNELQVQDVDAVLPFYQATVGITGEKASVGGLDDYTELRVGDVTVGGAFPKPQPELPARWVVYFMVTDVDEALVRAQNLGATILAPAFDAPGVGRMTLISDPEGAPFYLLEPRMVLP